MITKAWLDGSTVSLERLAQMFGEGEVKVVLDAAENRYYLTAPEISTAPGERFDRAAEPLLRYLNGFAFIEDPLHERVGLNGEYRHDDGRQSVIIQAGVMHATAQMSATVVVTGPDGAEMPQPPSPWPARITKATAHADLAEALGILSRPPLHWVELWKVYEIVRESVRPSTIVTLGWTTSADYDSFGESANRKDVSGDSARHARRPGAPRHRPMPVYEGRSYVNGLVTKWVNWLA